MEFRQIKYFLTVAEMEHMTKAAEKLHIAQPALSKTIKNLEEDVGQQLFERTGNRIHLNDAGRIYERYARKVMNDRQQMEREMEEYRQTESATITIRMKLVLPLVQMAIIEFSKLHPSVKFDLASYFSMEDRLAPECDIVISASPIPAEAENEVTLLRERIMLGVPYGSELAEQESIKLKDCKDLKYILSAPLHSTLNEIMFRHCELAGFSPDIAITAGTTYDVELLMRDGFGVSFVPEITWYYLYRTNTYHLVEICEPECTRYINLTWKDEGYVSKASVLFRKFLIEFSKKHIEELKAEHHLP